MTISFRIKIGIILITVCIIMVLLIQFITKNYTEKLMIDNLIKSKYNYLEVFKEGVAEARLLDSSFLLGNIIRDLRSDEDIAIGILLHEKNKISISTQATKKGFCIGDTYNFNIDEFTNKEDYYIKKLPQELILVKDFILKDIDGHYKEYFVILNLKMDKINAALTQLTQLFIVIGSFVILLAVIFTFPVSTLISKRVVSISKATEIIGSGDWEHKIPIKTRWRDELDNLAEKINEMSAKIKDYIFKLVDHERIKTEIEIGQKIQARMLAPFDPSSKRFDIAGFCYPAKEIGGDFYDFIKISGEKTLITIADVVGKGVGAGILSTMYMTLINTEPLNEIEPVNLIKKTNNFLYHKSLEDDYLTAVIGILDHEKKEFEFCCAMHDSPLLYTARENKIIELTQKDSFWLGQDNDEEFAEGYDGSGIKKQIIKFEKGDTLLLYTDGITEQVNKENQDMGLKKLTEIFFASKDLTSQEIINTIYKSVLKYKEDIEQKDDLTGIVIKTN